MSITVNDLLSRAQTIVQDTTGVFWPFNELLGWFNDARRAVLLANPAAGASNEVFRLSPGSYQQLPSDAMTVLRLYRNVQTSSGAFGGSVLRKLPATERQPGLAVRIVDRHVMDSQLPNWHTMTQATEVVHYMVDESDPTTFYVYPPNDGSGFVEGAFCRVPDEVTEAVLTQNPDIGIGLPDVFGNAILDYMLFRAYQKNSNYSASGQRSSDHYALFAGAVGARDVALMATSPNTDAKESAEEHRTGRI